MANLLLANPRWEIDGGIYPILLVEANGKTLVFGTEQKLLARGVPAVVFTGDRSLTYDYHHDNGFQVDTYTNCSDDPGLVQLVREFLDACADGTFEPHPVHPLQIYSD